jgi:hypothetical protein
MKLARLLPVPDSDIHINRYYSDFTLIMMLMRLHHHIAGPGDAKEEGSH